MRIDVIGRNLAITDAIRDRAETKAAKLHRYSDQIQQITVRVEKLDHQQHGQFGVEIVVDVERRDDFIASEKSQDVYQAIDTAVDRVARQLRDYNEKLKLGNR